MSHFVHKLATTTTAAALLVAGLAAGAAAQSAGSTAVSAQDARLIAARYLRAQGLTAPLRSEKTARIARVDLAGDVYEVTVFYGNSVPNQKAVLLIDAASGEIAGP